VHHSGAALSLSLSFSWSESHIGLLLNDTLLLIISVYIAHLNLTNVSNLCSDIFICNALEESKCINWAGTVYRYSVDDMVLCL
jgi:hypothetical protein